MRLIRDYSGLKNNTKAYLRFCAIAILIGGVLLMGLIRALTVYGLASQHQAEPLSPTIATHAVKSASTTVSIPSVATSASTASTARSSNIATKASPPGMSVAPNCTPDTTYSGPTSLSLSSAGNGVTTQIDPIHYYQINGYSAAQIRQQIINCAPKLSGDDDYTGYTSYRLSWQYGYVGNADGTCSITAPKIGIHIGEVLPSWQTSSLATPGLAAKWSAFVLALDTHERGHVALDQQYANQILANLQALVSTDCGSIASQANTLINAGVSALDAANVNYDNQTNHGATQGAILP